MKAFLTLSLLVLMATPICSFAQGKAPQIPVEKRQAYPMPEKQFLGTELAPNIPVNEMRPGEFEITNNRDVTVVQEFIGLTVYDLQSNAAVQNRIIQKDGVIEAAWTFGLTPTAYADRGTGYNMYDGSWNEEPYERIEGIRTGWPSLVQTASGRTVVINHAGVSTPLHMTYKEEGSSSWTETDLPAGDTPGQLWPRAAVGGADGNTLHVICITTPEANEGSIYQGQDGALLYFRSLDGGDTWDQANITFPELNSENFLGFTGDTYSIHARGDKVAFAVYNDFADSFVMISEDNGDTWSYRSLVDFPVDLYVVDTGLPEIGEDWNEDGLFQEFFNTDGAGSLIIDNDGKVHVFYGEMYYMDMELTDGNFSYFPGVNGLAYWNEDMDDNMFETIAFAYDLDESGTLDIDEIALYFVSISGMPSAGVDADNNLYVSYSALMESHSTGVQNFRHLYVVRSEDGGTTWSTETACNLTPDLDFDFYEAVFGSMVQDIEDEIMIVYQRDFEPGLHIRGDEDPSADNDIMFLRVNKDQFAACDQGEDIEYTLVDEEIKDSDLALYPNPAGDVVNIVLNKQGTAELRIFDLSGQLLFEDLNAQSLTRFDCSELAAGAYMVQMQTATGSVVKQLLID